MGILIMTNDLATIAAAHFPESPERTARCLEALKTDREQIMKWCREKIRGHRDIAIRKQDVGDHEMASTHIAIESAYFGLLKELEESSDSRKREA